MTSSICNLENPFDNASAVSLLGLMRGNNLNCSQLVSKLRVNALYSQPDSRLSAFIDQADAHIIDPLDEIFRQGEYAGHRVIGSLYPASRIKDGAALLEFYIPCRIGQE